MHTESGSNTLCQYVRRCVETTRCVLRGGGSSHCCSERIVRQADIALSRLGSGVTQHCTYCQQVTSAGIGDARHAVPQSDKRCGVHTS